MGGGIAGKMLLGMPLAGAALGGLGSGFAVLTNKSGENALADVLRNVGKEVSNPRICIHQSVYDTISRPYEPMLCHPS